jgi:hypothetical protein
LLDGGLGTGYSCPMYPSKCGNTPSCACLTQTTGGCQCSESSAGFTVTCMYP